MFSQFLHYEWSYPYFTISSIITEKLPKVKGVNMYFHQICEGGTFFQAVAQTEIPLSGH